MAAELKKEIELEDPMLDDLRGSSRFEALAEKVVPARLFQTLLQK